MTESATAITLDQRIECSDQVLFQNLAGEAVLLDLASETYFGLNPVGTRIWELLGNAPVLAEVCIAVQSEFDVDTAKVQTDVLALTQQLLNAGLVRAVV